MDAPGEPRAAAAPDAVPVVAEPPARRTVKLVVTLEPNADGYRALLALAADGCDPAFLALAVDGLEAALAAVPALRDDAEVRWREQPRYPAATAVRQRHGPAPTAVGAKPPEPAAPTPSAAQAQAAPPTGQLPLFG